jgi:hypothetical protein
VIEVRVLKVAPASSWLTKEIIGIWVTYRRGDPYYDVRYTLVRKPPRVQPAALYDVVD